MISIIIPTYNEAETITKLINFLQQHNNGPVSEIIIADGGSNDDTVALAAKAGAIARISPQKGRAAQMNFGASLATGGIFYFIHADTMPAATFTKDIKQAINDGYSFGRYCTKFDSDKWILKLNSLFTKFDFFVSYGGDQTLFITRELFNAINGFNDSMLIMEDYDIVIRAKQKALYKVIKKEALVNTRKYKTNTWWQILRANSTIVMMYKRGAPQQAMVNKYKKMLNYP